MEEKHKVHKYRRFIIGEKGHMIFKCMIPGCSHFLPNKELALGALCECWGGCGKSIELNYLHTSQKHTGSKPLCEDCKDTKKKRREMLTA